MANTTIIPARFNSKRFPGKALHPVAGVPLVIRAYSAATASDIPVWVATDDCRIYKAAKNAGANAILTSKLHESGTDRVAEVARSLSLSPSDIVINIQGDQPYIPPNLPNLLVDLLESSPDNHMATAVVDRVLTIEEIRDENVVKALLYYDGDSHEIFSFQRSLKLWGQEARLTARKHIGVYAYRNSFLQTLANLPKTPNENKLRLEQLRALDNGYRILTVKLKEDIHDVNTYDDLMKVENWLKEINQ